MYYKEEGVMKQTDELGRRLDCHFCNMGKIKTVCTILKDFYNRENSSSDLCGDCPFFKTEDEFWSGWQKRV